MMMTDPVDFLWRGSNTLGSACSSTNEAFILVVDIL